MKTSDNAQAVASTTGFFGEIIFAVTEAAGAIARRAYARYRQRRQVQDIFNMLHQLDDHSLRDIGLHRSEIRSVAAEIAGEAERTRRHTCPACSCDDDQPGR